jgi:hypothetical protein
MERTRQSGRVSAGGALNVCGDESERLAVGTWPSNAVDTGTVDGVVANAVVDAGVEVGHGVSDGCRSDIATDARAESGNGVGDGYAGDGAADVGVTGDGMLEQRWESEARLARALMCEREAAVALDRRSVALEEPDQRLLMERTRQPGRVCAGGASDVCGGESGHVAAGKLHRSAVGSGAVARPGNAEVNDAVDAEARAAAWGVEVPTVSLPGAPVETGLPRAVVSVAKAVVEPTHARGSAPGVLDLRDGGNAGELRRENADEHRRGSADELRRETADELRRGSVDELRRETADELRRENADEHRRGSADELRRETADELRRETADELRRETADELR